MAVFAIVTVGLLVLADQLFKLLAVNKIAPDSSFEVIDGLLSFTYLENRGAAFGILQNKRWVFIIATILILGVFIYILWRYTIKSKTFLWAVILIVAGGAGNLIDRIFLGYVVDFIAVSFFPPVFNFADCCVTIGAVLLVVSVLFFKEVVRKKEKEA